MGTGVDALCMEDESEDGTTQWYVMAKKDRDTTGRSYRYCEKTQMWLVPMVVQSRIKYRV